jgi:aspartyl-tRNA(Asn)/glutamyl-tRNA(Gln) amidotransferase subunit A
MTARPTLAQLAADLTAGRTTSRALVEEALARIADPAGEGSRVFVKVYAEASRVAADAQDRLRGAGYVASPLAGIPVSIKDLFDVAGEVTLAARGRSTIRPRLRPTRQSSCVSRRPERSSSGAPI